MEKIKEWAPLSEKGGGFISKVGLSIDVGSWLLEKLKVCKEERLNLR